MEKKCVWGQNLPWNLPWRNKARINIQPKNHSIGGKQMVVCYAIWAWTPKGLWQDKGKKWPKCHLKYAKSKWRLAMIRCASCNDKMCVLQQKRSCKWRKSIWNVAKKGTTFRRKDTDDSSQSPQRFIAKTPTFHHEDHGISLQRHWRFITKSTASHCKDNDVSQRRLRFFFWI